MTSLRFSRFSGLILCILFLLQRTDANNTLTIIQLRKSVQFSIDGEQLFLDLIRGNASRKSTEEFWAVYTDWTNYAMPSVMLASMLKYIPGYAGCVIFGLLFAILLPLIGIFYCCLRCCGRCGGRLSPMDRKADPYRRVCYTVTLALLVTVQLVAVVLAIINYHLCNEIINKGLSVGLAAHLKQGVNEFHMGITEVVDTAKNSSSVNLVAQKGRFDAVFDAGLIDFQKDFVNSSNASAVILEKEALQKVVYKFAPDSSDVTALKDFLLSLEKVTQELPFIQKSISDVLNTECTVNQLSTCRDLRFTTENDLKVTYALDQFQSTQVINILDTLKSAQQKVKDLDNFNASLLRMKEDVKTAIQPILDDAWNDLSNSPTTRKDFVKGLEAVADVTKTYLDQFNDIWDSYFPPENTLADAVVSYLELVLLSLPALMVVLFYLGLSFGVCGDRPHKEANCCNRGVGSNFLLSGMVFIFLFSGLLMLACTFLFTTGGLMQTEFCRYATHRHPAGPAAIDDALEVLQQQPELQNLSFSFYSATNNYTLSLKTITRARPSSVLLTRCANASLVDCLGDEIVGVMVSDKSINSFLDNILTTFNGIDLISPLRQTAMETLSTLNKVRDLQSYDFSEALMKTDEPLIGIADFDAYVMQLESLNIERLNDQVETLRKILDPILLHLKTPIRQIYADLQSIRGHYNQLADELNRFSSELDRTVPTSIRVQIESMRPLFLKELRLAVIASWQDIPCRGLYKAATTTVNAICTTFLDPYNGLVFGLGLFLVLCIPVLVFGGKLVNLYRKTEKYSPDYEQPDYISYQSFYMRPATSDDEAQSRRKRRTRKGKSSGGDGYMPMEPIA